jgi:hypothetical protein
MMKRSLAAAILLATATACGGAADPAATPETPGTPGTPALDPFIAAVPQVAKLGIAIDAFPAPAQSQALTVAGAGLEAADDLEFTRAAGRRVNAALAIVERLAPPAGTAGRDLRPGARAFGPVERCAADAAEGACPTGAAVDAELVVEERGAGAFAWALRARPAGAEGAPWARVYFGEVSPAAADPAAAEGAFVVDLEALRAAAWAFAGGGELAGGFAAGEGWAGVSYRVSGLSLEGERPGLSASVVAGRGADGRARLRASATRDVLPGPKGPELATSHVGLAPEGAAAYTVISNWRAFFGNVGDVPWTVSPRESYLLVRACFAPRQALVLRELFVCPSESAPADCAAAGVPERLAGADGATFAVACAFLPDAPELHAPAAAVLASGADEPEPGVVATPAPPASGATLGVDEG